MTYKEYFNHVSLYHESSENFTFVTFYVDFQYSYFYLFYTIYHIVAYAGTLYTLKVVKIKSFINFGLVNVVLFRQGTLFNYCIKLQTHDLHTYFAPKLTLYSPKHSDYTDIMTVAIIQAMY